MTFAQGSRTQFAQKVQSGLGVPATGNFTRLPFNTASLKADIQGIESMMIRSDREVEDYRHGGRSVSGDMEYELRDSDHEAVISSLLFNTWTSDTIRIGTTPQYLSIEDQALDIVQYRLFTDMLATKGKFRFVPNEIVKLTTSWVGTTMTASNTSSAGTVQPGSSNQPYDSINGAIYDNAAETGSELAIITSLEIDIDNGANPVFVIGSTNAANIESGRGKITGTLTAFYEDLVWVNRHLNETIFSVVMNITDPQGNSLEFRMDRCKVNAADVPVQNEQSRIITMPFVSLKPSSSPLGSASALVINRS